MQKIELLKRITPSGKNVYTARHGGREVFSSGRTIKNYVAVVIDRNGNAVDRFTSIQDIGTGKSKYTLEAQVEPYIAVLPNLIHNVRLPKKIQYNRYHILYGDWELNIVAESEIKAKQKAKAKYYKDRKRSVDADMFYIRSSEPVNYEADSSLDYKGYTHLKAKFNGLEHSPGITISHNGNRHVGTVRYTGRQYYDDVDKFTDARDKALATAQVFKNAPDLLHQLQVAYAELCKQSDGLFNFKDTAKGMEMRQVIERALAPLQYDNF